MSYIDRTVEMSEYLLGPVSVFHGFQQFSTLVHGFCQFFFVIPLKKFVGNSQVNKNSTY